MRARSEELEVACPADCGNAPKKALLRDLSIAFAKNDTNFCVDWVTDDVVWDVVGEQLLRGKAEFANALHARKERLVRRLQIDHIITHGNTGSVNGTLQLDNGLTLAFCDVYSFRGFGKNAKIKRITSYVIPTR